MLTSISDPRQAILIAIVFAVPGFLLLNARYTALMRWIALSVAIDVFTPNLIVNLPAARVAGLLLVPLNVRLVRKLLKNRAGSALIAYFSYLVLLAVLFGFVFPWSSEGFARTWTQLAPGRAVVYVARKLADVSLIVFVSGYVFKTGRPDRIIRWLVAGTSLAAAASLLQLLSGWDLYSLMTGITSLDLPDRMRGLNYEPRGLGLVAAYGLALSLAMYARGRSLKLLPIVLLHVAAISLSVSTSGLFAAGAGLLVLLFFDRQSRGPVVAFGVALLIAAAILQPVLAEKGWDQTWAYEVQSRLTSDKPGSAPKGFMENLALRMDLFDASAFLMLATRPGYLFSGTGPGLIGLPSTDFIPQAALWNWVWQSGKGLNTVPHMGLLREMSDVGLIGLLLWCVFVRSGYSALSRLEENKTAAGRVWGLGRIGFLIAVAIYIVDASPLAPIESVLAGIGLGAALTVFESRKPPTDASHSRPAPVLAPRIDSRVHARQFRIRQP